MSDADSEKHLNQTPTGKAEETKVPDARSDSEKPNGGRLLFQRLVQFFRKEMPERFGLAPGHLLFIFIMGLAVFAWVSFFGYVRARDGKLHRPLRVGIVSWPGYAGGLVANNGLGRNKDSDFWKNDNKLLVEFVEIDTEDELRRQFERGGDKGGIDIMWSTVDSLAHQLPEFLSKDVHPRAFLQVDWSYGADAIVARGDIKQVEDMKGKTVAVSMAASLWLFESSLKSSRLTDGDKDALQITRIKTEGSSQALQHFVRGEAQAAVLWEPDVTEALKIKDAHVLVDSRIATNLIADVMVAKEKFIQDWPDVIQAFINGWFEGTRRAINNPMLAVKVLKEERGFANLDDDEIRRLLGKVSWSTLDDNRRMFGLSGSRILFDELFAGATDLWFERHYLTDRSRRPRAEDAREAGPLKVSSLGAPPAREPDCRSSIMTSELVVQFPPGKTELTPEIQQTLNGPNVSWLFQIYPQASFCVKASNDGGNDPRPAREISRARANAVIDYLVKRYDRRPGQFMSEVPGFEESVTDGKPVGYIRLSVIN